MFAKKLLSVVALLFLGSQSVYAAGEVCTPTYDGSSCTPNNCSRNVGDVFLVTGTDKGEGNKYAIEIKNNNGATECGVAKSYDDATHEYCVGDNNEILGITRDAFCLSAQCTQGYYKCTRGVCERQDGSTCGVDCSSGLPASGGCTVPGYYVTATNTEGIKTLAAKNADGYLYQCTTSICTPVEKKVGYYLSATGAGNGDIIVCAKGATNGCAYKDPTPATNGCTDATNIGDVIKLSTGGAIKICYGNTDNAHGVELKSGATGLRVLDIGASNSLGLVASSKYVVEISGTSAFIRINASNDEHYLRKSESTEIEDGTGVGTLLTCAQTTGVCTNVSPVQVGYYKNAGSNTNEYISCEVNAGKDGIECKPYTVVNVGSGSCDATEDALNNHITPSLVTGDIIKKSDNEFYLCLGTTSTSNAKVENGMSYFISVNAKNIFGENTDSFVLVNMENGNALRDNLSASIPRYRYTDDKHKISSNSEDGMCDAQKQPDSKIVEFKHEVCETETVQTNYYRIVEYPTVNN